MLQLTNGATKRTSNEAFNTNFTWRLWTSIVITAWWPEQVKIEFFFKSFYLSMHCKKKENELISIFRKVEYDCRAIWICFHGGPSILTRSEKKNLGLQWFWGIIDWRSKDNQIFGIKSTFWTLFHSESFHWKWKKELLILGLNNFLNSFNAHQLRKKIIFQDFNGFCTLAVSFALLLTVIPFSTF